MVWCGGGEVFLGEGGNVGIFVFGDAGLKLLLGSGWVVELFKSAAGFVECSGGPLGGGVEDIDFEEFAGGGFILFLGEPGFTGLELGTSAEFAVVGGDDLGVLIAGLIGLCAIFEGPAEAEVARGARELSAWVASHWEKVSAAAG